MQTKKEDAAPVAVAMPGTPAWLTARYDSIGASEAAAACGLSPYRQPLDVYLAKVNRTEVEQTDAMMLGNWWEPVVMRYFQHTSGLTVQAPQPMYRSAECPFVTATPDGMAADAIPGTDAPPALSIPVEVKTTTWRRASEWGEEGSDDIPQDYLLQAQQQMFVLQAQRCEVAVMLDVQTIRRYTVHRHDDLIAMLVQAETELWARIVARDPPEPNYHHESSQRIVRAMFGTVEPGKTCFMSKRQVDLWKQYQLLGEQIGDLEKERKRVATELEYSIGDAELAVMPQGQRAVRKTMVTRRNLALSKLPAAASKAVEPYVTTSTFPRFTECDYDAGTK